MLTIVFCDLVDSTALSTRLDPEDLHEVLASYQRSATDIVEAAGGVVARYSGDGVLAYFGYPHATEEDAERAVRAGLQLVAVIQQKLASAERLSVRVGIATGTVVVGDLLRSAVADNPPIVGETANLAARLQTIADPNAVVISPSTHRLTGGLFKYRDLGVRELKGFEERVRAWQVIGSTEVAGRFEALRSQESSLVGREEELEVLLRRWGDAQRGEGRVVVLSGEAGIGKSRTTVAFEERLQNALHATLRYFCSPHHRDSALHPIIAQLQRATGMDWTDAPETKLDKREAVLGQSRDNATEGAALLAHLMGLPTERRYAPLTSDTRRRRALTLATLIHQLEQRTQSRPVLVVFEDVQWIDPSSRELLEMVVERVNGLRILLVITCRPEFRAPWVGLPHVTLLTMRRLSQREATELVEQIGRATPLSSELVAQIVRRADGIPLFVEELAKSFVGGELSQDGRSEKEIPSSLQTLLMAQLDGLGAAKKIAQIGAAVGREFSYELLTTVAQRPEQELRDSLDRLLAAGLVVRRGMPQSETIIFRHALIQDAAYNTLLRERRKAVHGRIAAALDHQFQDVMDTQPELLAHHYAQAGQANRAINYWLKAGNRAADRSANVEAVRHFREGIRLAQLLPPGPERERQELDLHIGLGPAVMATKGYGAPESLQVYLNARNLAEKTVAVSEQLQVLMGVFNVHYSRAELYAALGTAREYLAIAACSGQSEGRAHVLLGQTHSAMGSFLDARCELQRALDDCGRSADFDRPAGGLASQNVVALSLIAGVLFALGYSKRAMAATAEAVRIARKSEHALSMALAMVSQLLTPLPGGLEADPAHAKEVVKFCSQHGLKNFEAWALFAQGASTARRGQAREGIELMRAGVDAAEATGSRLFRPVHFACLASAHARLGEIEEGLLLIRDAIEIAKNRGERQSEPALHRLQGEMLAASGTRANAEAELRKALELAHAQYALSEEVRIACSLAQLLRAQQREADAFAILAPVCDRCSEGFDPLGLENAKRLCDEIRCRAT